MRKNGLLFKFIRIANDRSNTSLIMYYIISKRISLIFLTHDEKLFWSRFGILLKIHKNALFIPHEERTVTNYQFVGHFWQKGIIQLSTLYNFLVTTKCIGLIICLSLFCIAVLLLTTFVIRTSRSQTTGLIIRDLSFREVSHEYH